MTTDWFTSPVFHGLQNGRKIGFPTLNPNLLSKIFVIEGVYAANVKVNSQNYQGALYYGPRLVLNETKNVLEIFILDFNQEIYDQEISFQLKKFIRGVLPFSTLENLEKQLETDIQEVRNSFDKKSSKMQ